MRRHPAEDVIDTPIKAAAKARRPRRSHAQRSAETQARLLDATVDCLHQFGYAATSTVLVAAHAGLSRGAMQHQFSTKTELILAVIQYAMNEQDTEIRRRLRTYDRGYERFMAISRVAWDLALHPRAQALLEIEIGCRSDPDLADRSRPIFRAAQQQQLNSVWEVAADMGITDRARVDQLTLMNIGAERGLAMAILTAEDRRPFDRAFEMLMEHKVRVTGELLAAEGLKPPKPAKA